MKIKHWQGYGFLNAEKINKSVKTIFGKKLYTIKIKVVGNHEYGLNCYHDRFDNFTVYNWLLTKFDHKTKELTDDCILKVSTELGETQGEEYAIYTIKYSLDDSYSRYMLADYI